METPFLLKDIVIIFALSVFMLYLFHQFHIPSIVGFILAGIVVGPYGLGFVEQVEEVEILADIGVILLLFTIGMEFSFKNLLKLRKAVLVAGPLQVFLTVILCSLLLKKVVKSPEQAIFIGLLASLSSTAIVLKILNERAEFDSPYGTTTMGMLIFQDLIIVAFIFFTPLLAGVEKTLAEPASIIIAKALGVVIFVLASVKWIVPQLLYQITKTKNRELFLLVIVVICLTIALLTSMLGLSLALGAFLAGLIISETEYSHQALGGILPFRDVFISFFFVSVGMLFDVSFLLQNPLLILASILCVLFLKAVTACVAVILSRFPLRIAILTGFSLSQIGEFSFILARTGLKYRLIGGDIYQVFLSVSILTMAITPFIISSAPYLADIILKLPFPQKIKSGFYPLEPPKEPKKKEHLIIVGFGVNGRNLALACKSAGIPYVVIEMNVETVKQEREKGEPIYYGDAIHEAVLKHANIEFAKVLVVAINDPVAIRRITHLARRLNPKLYIIVRTRFLSELKPLMELGANEVIPEEFETSVEIFTRVLKKYLIPKTEIEKFVSQVRSDSYEMFRGISYEPGSICDLRGQFPQLEVTTFRVNENAPLANKTLAQLELRKKYGVTVVAINRNSQLLPNPDGDTKVYPGDLLIVLGAPEKIIESTHLFQEEKE